MRYNIRQLAAQPLNVHLVHPVLGDTGIFVKVVGPQSKQFRDALTHFESLSEEQQKDPVENARVFTSCILSWDPEDFGEPFSVEAAIRIFLEPENSWIANFLTKVVKDHTLFFRKPD